MSACQIKEAQAQFGAYFNCWAQLRLKRLDLVHLQPRSTIYVLVPCWRSFLTPNSWILSLGGNWGWCTLAALSCSGCHASNGIWRYWVRIAPDFRDALAIDFIIIWCFLVDPTKADLMWPPITQIRFIDLECFSASSLDSLVYMMLGSYSTWGSPSRVWPLARSSSLGAKFLYSHRSFL